ncbi:MAG: RimK/LysX family protein [Marinobacterium sp.]|nr:RimK/LysX family protein [Marinobacterium sp.]
MFHSPSCRAGYCAGLVSVIILSLLSGCQALNSTLNPQSAKAPETAKAIEKPTQLEPVKCPQPRTITQKVIVYTPVKIGNKQLFGETEMGTINTLDMRLPARIDTGARTTSLHATDIEQFERDGRNWVRFRSDRNGDAVKNWELPLKRTVRIKRKQGGVIERPVVELKVKIGEVVQRLDVNLADRSNFEFPLLVGRDFLQDLVIVDVSKRYIADQPEARPTAEAIR